MDENQRIEVEARTFRKLLSHLQSHTEVQNIDLMIEADFCRNCLAKWYKTAADELGVQLSYSHALSNIYGMPYEEWKTRFQSEVSSERLKQYEEKQKRKQATTST